MVELGRRAALALGGVTIAAAAGAAQPASLFEFRMEAIEGGSLDLGAWTQTGPEARELVQAIEAALAAPAA